MKRLHLSLHDVQLIHFMERRADQLRALREGEAYAPADIDLDLVAVLYRLGKWQAWKEHRWSDGVWCILFQSTIIEKYTADKLRQGRTVRLSRRTLNYKLAALERDSWIKRQPRPKPIEQRTPGRVRFDATCYTLLPKALMWIKTPTWRPPNGLAPPRVQNFARSPKDDRSLQLLSSSAVDKNAPQRRDETARERWRAPLEPELSGQRSTAPNRGGPRQATRRATKAQAHRSATRTTPNPTRRRKSPTARRTRP